MADPGSFLDPSGWPIWMPSGNPSMGLVKTPREPRVQTVDGKTFDQAYAEMLDTVQHIRNAGGGFGLNINQPALDDWANNGPTSPNIEDRRNENTVRGKTEQRTLLNRQLKFADGMDSPGQPPPPTPSASLLDALKAMFTLSGGNRGQM